MSSNKSRSSVPASIKRVRFNVNENTEKTKDNSDLYVTTGFFIKFKRQLVQTPNTTSRHIKSGPSFDLPQENMSNRVNMLRSNFSPRVLNALSITSIKKIATIYPLPKSDHSDAKSLTTDRVSKAAKADNAAVPTEL